VFNATTIALIRIDTIDSVSLVPASVGYVCFKLFASRERKQPKQANESGVYINTGAFQFPIFGGRLSPSSSTNFDEFLLSSLPKIPCASLLVRIFSAPKSSDGITTISKSEYPMEDWARLVFQYFMLFNLILTFSKDWD
jgi:hypothetical protein